jgi:hypothetical protein
MTSSFHSLIPFLPFLLSYLGLPSPELDPVLDNSLKWTRLQLNSLDFWQLTQKSKSHWEWRLVSKSWCRAPSGAYDKIFITVWQLRSCFCGAPSLTRGRVCLLYMLLALASAVFLGSEFLRTCEIIVRKVLVFSICFWFLCFIGGKFIHKFANIHWFVEVKVKLSLCLTN